MRKETGNFILEMYDKFGHKESEAECLNYIRGENMAKNWESREEGNTAVLSRILYNTVSRNSKQDYK